MSHTRIGEQVRFILEVDKLKEIFRQTLCTQSRRPENDAEHSWHLCRAAIVLAEHANEPRLDMLRVLKMLILHYLVEIDAGDTFAYDTARMAGQHEREALAADRIFGLLPGAQAAEFRALWDEFEDRRTPESRYAAAIDRFQPCLLNCNTEGAAWRRHGSIMRNFGRGPGSFNMSVRLMRSWVIGGKGEAAGGMGGMMMGGPPPGGGGGGGMRGGGGGGGMMTTPPPGM